MRDTPQLLVRRREFLHGLAERGDPAMELRMPGPSRRIRPAGRGPGPVQRSRNWGSDEGPRSAPSAFKPMRGNGAPRRPRRPTGCAVPSHVSLASVGLGRVELPTSRLSGVRSNHLSYRPQIAAESTLAPPSKPPPATGCHANYHGGPGAGPSGGRLTTPTAPRKPSAGGRRSSRSGRPRSPLPAPPASPRRRSPACRLHPA